MNRSHRRRAIAVVCALGLAVGAAACGGDTAVVTITTDRLPGTETTASVPAPPTTSTTQTTTDTGTTTTTATTTSGTTASSDPVDMAALAELLPPAAAMAGVNEGTVRELPTAGEMIDTLYQAGDPTAEPAKAELSAAGYRGGVLRDDSGTDPQNGLALFRSYIFAVADDATAIEQSKDSVADVRSTAALTTRELAVPGIPDGTGVSATGEQSGTRLAVAFISFPVRDRVYGLQVVARAENAIDLDKLVEVAQVIHAQGMRSG